MAPREARVICGTYSHLIYAADLSIPESEDGVLRAEPVWLFEGHAASVRCMDRGGRYLATGSSDEMIKLYDLRKRKELGGIIVPDANTLSSGVTSLTFTRSHLISTHESGTLMIWRTRDWSCLATLRANPKMPSRKECLNDCAVHPSEKFAFTVGRDRKLRLWNLVKGRAENVQQLPARSEPLGIVFASDGKHYAIRYDRALVGYDLEGQQLFEVKSSHKIHALAALAPRLYVCGDEAGRVWLVDIETGKESAAETLHSSRVKSISVLRDTVYSVSTDGTISVSEAKDGPQDGQVEIKLLGTHKLPANDLRVTTILAVDPDVEDFHEVVKRRKVLAARRPRSDMANASESEADISEADMSEPESEAEPEPEPEAQPKAPSLVGNQRKTKKKRKHA